MPSTRCPWGRSGPYAAFPGYEGLVAAKSGRMSAFGAQLRREGHLINHKKVARVMRENDLIAVARQRVCTTNSVHGYTRYPNLIHGLKIVRPDQLWSADITYVRLSDGFVYLAILIDVYTRALRGWHLGRSLSTELTVNALECSLARGVPEIHHSDQGIQYACGGYTNLLTGLGVAISMSAPGQPTQNPYAERVIGTIKQEEVYLSEYESFTDAHQCIGHFIEDVYQTKRIHSSLSYLTPVEYEAAYWQRVRNPLT